MTAEEARELVTLAARAGVVHGVSFVYRQFAMVQQAAAMIRHGEVGRIFAAHGSYLQDWMLLETDYNWRVDSAQGGASRTVADIGSHWCDTVQFMTGRRIVEVMADLSIVWPTRKAPVNGKATFSAVHEAQGYETRPVDTEDFGSVLLRFDDGSKGSFMVSQVSAGRKNRLAVEVNGSRCSLAWDQEVPQRLWIGHREQPDRRLSDDPSLLWPEIADSAHYPGGHIEGWPDAFKNMMGHFYQAVRAGKMPEAGARRFAAFDDGADVMYIIEAIVKSHQQQRWVSVERRGRGSEGLFHPKIAVEIGTGEFVAEQDGIFIFHCIIPFVAGVAGKGVLGAGALRRLLFDGLRGAAGVAFAHASGFILLAAGVHRREGRQV